MDFGQSILQKYGWSEGQGLGKHNSGISKPLKANLKFDTSGLGHDAAAEYKDHWWENAYNSAASNLDVKTDGDSVKMELKDGQSVKISTSGLARSDTKSSMYGNFVRCATLTSEGREDRIEEENGDAFPEYTPLARPLTDEELLKACGGRTAHKGARHGLRLSGKLARLAEQDNLLLQKMGEDKEDPTAEYSEWQRKVNKKKKRRPIAAPTPHGSPEAVSDDQDALLCHSLEMCEAASQEKRLTKESLMRMSTKSHRIQKKHKKRKREDASASEQLMSELYEQQQSAERRAKKRDKKRRREVVESSNSTDSSRSHKRLRAVEDPLVDRGVFETSTGIQVELDDPTPERREKRCATQRKSSTRRNIRQITDRFARSLTTKEPSDDEGIDP